MRYARLGSDPALQNLALDVQGDEQRCLDARGNLVSVSMGQCAALQASDSGPCVTRDGKTGYETIGGCLPLSPAEIALQQQAAKVLQDRAPSTAPAQSSVVPYVAAAVLLGVLLGGRA